MEAILYLGEINSRMKDFFDCYRMIDEYLLSGAALKIAIKHTFSTRDTMIELIPNELKEVHQSKWNAFTKKEKINHLNLPPVIDAINRFLTANDII